MVLSRNLINEAERTVGKVWQLMQRVCACCQTPLMVIEGNHEIEKDAANRTFQAYVHRFKVPHAESGSASPLYYSFDIAGARSTSLSPIGLSLSSCSL